MKFLLILVYLTSMGQHGVGVELNEDHRPQVFDSQEDCKERGEYRLAHKGKDIVWAQGQCWAVPATANTAPTAPALPQRPTQMPDRI